MRCLAKIKEKDLSFAIALFVAGNLGLDASNLSQKSKLTLWELKSKKNPLCVYLRMQMLADPFLISFDLRFLPSSKKILNLFFRYSKESKEYLRETKSWLNCNYFWLNCNYSWLNCIYLLVELQLPFLKILVELQLPNHSFFAHFSKKPKKNSN